MAKTEKHAFQAEIKQILDIVIHSLYTDKEIFVRELVSNASDACEKLRFSKAAGTEVHQPEVEPKISVTTDDQAHTVTIADSGIGMTHDELIANLGTIAHSGSKAFLKQLAEGQKADASLIGQFGVGFYSAFMVGKEVEVHTRSAQADAEGWKWVSDGSGEYTMEPAAGLDRGTKIIVKLKDEAKEFAEKFKVQQIINRYSNFVSFPIELNGERLNTVQAIWTRSKSDIKPEEYDEFYKYIGHDHEAALFRLHFSADAPLAIKALLFVPSRNFETMGLGKSESEVNLHCKKVLIQPRAKGLFPEWLRFLRGVVDSEDLPLNISRESMQDSALMAKLNKVITGRFLKFLDEEATKNPEQFQKFYDVYSRFLKEGVVTDHAHKEQLGKLLRFNSSTVEAGKTTSLAEYISRMPSEQKDIYYVIAPSREAAEASPYYEVLAHRKYEALFLHDPWDEFVMEHLSEFDGKKLVSAEKADLKIEQPHTREGVTPLTEDEGKALSSWLRDQLGDTVTEVRASNRLIDSPAVVLSADKFASTSMKKLMQAAGGGIEPAKYEFEINPHHPIIVGLNRTREAKPELAKKVAEQVFDNARFAAGLLDDPRSMVKRLNSLLEEFVAEKK
jgi:TNF receptor-associated protein 1